MTSGVIDEKARYGLVATNYQLSRPQPPQDLIEWLAAVAPANNFAWDCGAGNGQSSQHLADIFNEVAATDISPDQIATAIQNPRIAYRVAAAECSGLKSHCADLITVAMAAHWFKLDEFYREATRVLKPQGVLAMWAYQEPRSADPKIDCLLQDFSKLTTNHGPSELRLVHNGYKDLPFPPDYYAVVPAKDYAAKGLHTLDTFIRYCRTKSSARAYIEDTGHDAVADLDASLRDVCGAPEQPQAIFWPLALKVARRSP